MFDCDIPSNACSRDSNLSALDSSPCFVCGVLFTSARYLLLPTFCNSRQVLGKCDLFVNRRV